MSAKKNPTAHGNGVPSDSPNAVAMGTIPPYSKSLGYGACFQSVEPCILLIRLVYGSLKYVLKESSQMCPIRDSSPGKNVKITY